MASGQQLRTGNGAADAQHGHCRQRPHRGRWAVLLVTLVLMAATVWAVAAGTEAAGDRFTALYGQAWQVARALAGKLAKEKQDEVTVNEIAAALRQAGVITADTPLADDPVLTRFLHDQLAEIRQAKAAGADGKVEDDPQWLATLRRDFGDDITLERAVMLCYAGELQDRYERAAEPGKAAAVALARRDLVCRHRLQDLMGTSDVVRLRLRAGAQDEALQLAFEYLARQRCRPLAPGKDCLVLLPLCRRSPALEGAHQLRFHSRRLWCFVMAESRGPCPLSSAFLELDPDLQGPVGGPWPGAEDEEAYLDRLAAAWQAVPPLPLPPPAVAALEAAIAQPVAGEQGRLDRGRLQFLLGRPKELVNALVAAPNEPVSEPLWACLAHGLVLHYGDPRVLQPDGPVCRRLDLPDDLHPRLAAVLKAGDPTGAKAAQWREFFLQQAVRAARRCVQRQVAILGQPALADGTPDLVALANRWAGRPGFYLLYGALAERVADEQQDLQVRAAGRRADQKKDEAGAVADEALAARIGASFKVLYGLREQRRDDAEFGRQCEQANHWLRVLELMQQAAWEPALKLVEELIAANPPWFARYPLIGERSLSALADECRARLKLPELRAQLLARDAGAGPLFREVRARLPTATLRAILRQAGAWPQTGTDAEQVAALLAPAVSETDRFELRLLRAEVLIEQGDQAAALAALQQLQREAPAHPDVASLVRASQAEQRYDGLWAQLVASGFVEAKATIQAFQGPPLFPGSALVESVTEPLTRRARRAARAGQTRLALTALRVVAELSPPAAVDACLEEMLVMAGKGDAAAEPLQALPPLAWIVAAHPDRDHAAAAAKAVCAAFPGADANAQVEAAAKWMREQFGPAGERALCFLAIEQFYRQDQHDLALTRIADYLARFDDRREAVLLMKGLCTLGQGQHEAAIAAFAEVLRLAPKGSPRIPQAKFLTAWIRLLQGRKDDARAGLQQVAAEFAGSSYADKARQLLDGPLKP